MRRTCIAIVGSVVASILLAAPVLAQGSAATIVVTSTADNGPGTLRQALQDAQSGDTITFDPSVFPPDAPVAISLIAGLPELSGHLTIDASDAGVVVDGSEITTPEPGLSIPSNGNTIRGLQIVGFNHAGIALGGGAQHNVIGGDRGIGSGPLGQGNLISGNSLGVGIWGASFNTVTGNYIGTDLSGLNPFANREGGVSIELEAHGNVIGPGNVIAYNHGDGIVVGLNSVGNTITRNNVNNNDRKGISLLTGGNTELLVPFILDFDLQAGRLTGWTYPNSVVEVFSDSGTEGALYEGRVVADGRGFFAFRKEAAFSGARLIATATDPDGNTSEFTQSTEGSSAFYGLQEGNSLEMTALESKTSNQLVADDRLGKNYYYGWGDLPGLVENADYIYQRGVKRLNIGLNEVEAPINWDVSETEIPGDFDRFINLMNQDGVAVNYLLLFWDKVGHAAGEELPIPRFTTEVDIQRFLDYTRDIVRHFKGRVQYYTIWSEPDACGGSIDINVKCIEPLDYVDLARQLIPVILDEDPQAKIVTGPVVLYFGQDHLFTLLRSDVIQLFDVISTHPLYDMAPDTEFNSPEHRDVSKPSLAEYYYLYPSIIEDIRQTAAAHGFQGEYWGEDVEYHLAATKNNPYSPWPGHTWQQNGKYTARAVVMHLGLDAGVGVYNPSPYLYTILNGTNPVDLGVEIESEATNIVTYGFTDPNGDRLLALWTDGAAVDDDPGVTSTLTFPGMSASRVTGIDVLARARAGLEQELIVETESGNLVIRDFLVKDYPIILRMASSASTAILTEGQQGPATYELGDNYPNPFNPTTSIAFQVPTRSGVSIKIYNLIGQEVRDLAQEEHEPGFHRIEWSGLDNEGRAAATGMYLIRMTSNNYVKTKKCLLLR
ncbi:T9SS type A sorting domain-containing protein [Candidatus Latescibacterota bacterium]